MQFTQNLRKLFYLFFARGLDEFYSATAYIVSDQWTKMEKTCILFPLKTFHPASLNSMSNCTPLLEASPHVQGIRLNLKNSKNGRSRMLWRRWRMGRLLVEAISLLACWQRERNLILTILLNACPQQVKFQWNGILHITLLYKRGNMADLSNYGPISLFETAYKILSKVITRGSHQHWITSNPGNKLILDMTIQH